MASAFSVAESHTTTPTVVDPVSYLNLLNTNGASGSDATTNPTASPVPKPTSGTNYSYERWFRGHWQTGTGFTSISAITFGRTAGSIAAGVTINVGTTAGSAYSTPVNTQSAIATTSLANTVTTISLGPATLSAAGYSYYCVLQMAVGTTASAGTIGTQTYTFSWQEV